VDLPVEFEGYADIVTNVVSDFLVSEVNVGTRLADKDNVRLQVLTAVSMKITVFWDIVRCCQTPANNLQKRNDTNLHFHLR
jgi:hypothetical protein